MLTLRPVFYAAVSLTLTTMMPAQAASNNPSSSTCGSSCGTTIDNKISIDLTGLTDALKLAIDGLIKLGLKPTVVNGNVYINNGLINYGNYNSGTLNGSPQNTGVFNTGSGNVIKVLAGGDGGMGGGGHGGGSGGGGGSLGNGFKACANGAVCGRRW